MVGWEGTKTLEQATEAQLEQALARSVLGDQLAFAELVRQHQGMVFSLAYHFLRDRAVAEELAQEVFLHLHQSAPELKSAEHLTYWLRKVTTHRSIDQLRRQKVRPQVSLEEVAEPAVFPPNRDPMLSRTLRRIVATLPDKARAVLILRYQEDLEPAEIAELLEMPVNTVKSHLRRSLAILREKLSRCIEGAKV